MPTTEAGITVNPEILQVLGEQLVSDHITALSELVKNAYDADSERVEVEFSGGDKLVVSDNGHGMNLDNIRHGWLQIGTPLKRRTSTSPLKKRVFAGSMGIGRLAAFSLANEVKIQTGRDNLWYEFSLSFKEITQAASLESIMVSINQISPPKKSGTSIILTGLKWWPEGDELERMKQRLSLLAIPGNEKDFSILLRFDDFTTLIEPETSLPSAPIILEARIDGQGHVFSTLKANPQLYEGALPRESWVAEEGRNTVEYLRNVTLKAFWYALGERPGHKYWKSSLETRRALRDINGLRVYRDSIRVLPYGEKNDDWLDLQSKYVSGGSMERRPRPEQLTGWVTISRITNPDLGDVANRQGLRDTADFRALKKFCQDRMDEISQFRRELEPIVKREKEISTEDRPEIEKALDVVRGAISGNPVLEERFSLVEKAIGAFFDQQELTGLYRDRLTAGLLASLVMHDVGVPFRNAARIVAQASGEACANPNHKNALTIVNVLVDRVIQGYNLLGGGFSGDDYRIRNVPVNETVAATIAQLKAVSESESVRIKLEPAKDPLTARVRRADLWSIVTNLVANSIQSAGYAHARNRQFPSEREIVVSFKRERNDLEISSEDNGPGLPDKPPGWIWTPYNTTKPGGSGLGLYIVADTVASYAGTKEATGSTRFPTGSLFRITLPGVLQND